MISVETTVTNLTPSPVSTAILARLDSFFSNQGLATYIVGGFLRDLLLERETADIDLASASDAIIIGPLLAEPLGGSYVPLDEENRVARVVIKADETGHQQVHWQLDLSSYSDDIEQDLGRRDFTINAMAVSLSQISHLRAGGEVAVIDPFNGLGDLKKGIVKAISDNVFKDDPLRTLRAVRQAAELGFNIDTATEGLISNNAALLSDVATERSREELIRLLELPDSNRLWPYIDRLGLLKALIPEIEPMRGVIQPREHTWDVLKHSLKALAALDFILHQAEWPYTTEEVLDYVPWSPQLSRHFTQTVNGSSRASLTRLAALFHDIAKPQTRVITDDGRVRFFGHASSGAAFTAKILKRLRFSRRQINLVSSIVDAHLRPVQICAPGELPSERAIYRYFHDCGDAAIETLFFSLADHLATRGPELDANNWRRHTRIVEYILNQHNKQQERITPARLISGNDIIKHCGIKPGPTVGRILEVVREAQASGDISSPEEALVLATNSLKPEKKNRRTYIEIGNA